MVGFGCDTEKETDRAPGSARCVSRKSRQRLQNAIYRLPTADSAKAAVPRATCKTRCFDASNAPLPLANNRATSRDVTVKSRGQSLNPRPMAPLGRWWRSWRRRWLRRALSALRSAAAAPPGAANAAAGRWAARDGDDAPLACALYARAVAFRRGRELPLRLRVAPRVPVLSVGNVTFGATGKTPMAQLLAGLALRSAGATGKTPLLLSRVRTISSPSPRWMATLWAQGD